MTGVAAWWREVKRRRLHQKMVRRAERYAMNERLAAVDDEISAAEEWERQLRAAARDRASVAAMTGNLTANDRCDRCRAAASMRVTLHSGQSLLFCAHHGREHAAKLREVAHTILDESGKIGR